MSDLRIVVIDENDNVLRELEIYEDGSDSEACDTIAKAIGEKFESLATINVPARLQENDNVTN